MNRGCGAMQTEILGIRVDRLGRDDLFGLVLECVKRRERSIVANVNAHAMNLACDHSWFRRFLNGSRAVYCDGAGVILGARILGRPAPPRLPLSDWAESLVAVAAGRNASVGFLGGRPGVAECAAERMRERYAGLRIAMAHHGYFDKTPDSPGNLEVVRRVNDTRPDILFVGFGMPLQEKWLDENWGRLDGACVAIPGGAIIERLAGELPRVHPWLVRHGLEWLGRLVREPRRLWRRNLIGIPAYLGRVMAERLGLR